MGGIRFSAQSLLAETRKTKRLEPFCVSKKTKTALAERSQETLYWSTFGAIAILGLSGGSLMFWEACKHLPSYVSVPPILLITVFWWLGCTVHFSYGFIGDALQVQASLEGAAHTAMQTHLDNIIGGLFLPLWGIAILIFFVGSTWFAVIVALGWTRLPRWYAPLAPFFPIAAAFFATTLLPAPVGGYVYPAFVHVGTPLTFGIGLWLLWNDGRTARL